MSASIGDPVVAGLDTAPIGGGRLHV